MEDVLTHHEMAVIHSRVSEMKQNLDTTFFTSPVRGAIVGGIIGAAFSTITNKPGDSSNLGYDATMGALLGSAIAGFGRSLYMAGWGCGFCTGASEGKEF